MAGSSWMFVSGTAEESFFDNTKLNFNLYSVAPAGGDPCALSAYSFSDPLVMFTVVNSAGLYQLGLNQTVTLFANGTNYITTTGQLEIMTISPGSVTGRIVANFDASNNVNGNFTVTFCP